MLRRARPVIVFEHFPRHAAAYGTTSEDVHDALTDLGYRIFDLDVHGALGASEFAELAATETSWNFLARR